MGHGDSGGPGLVATLRGYLPRGNLLDAETFHRRHLLLCWILGLHVPALFAFGVAQGYGVGHSALEVTTPAACLVFARLAHNRRFAAFFATAGLVFCSSVLVHMSGGTIEAHFHFFILIGLIALYQDWVPFLWNVIFTVLSHGIGSVMDSSAMYNHYAAQNRPWLWAIIHGVAVLAACVGVVIFWKHTEMVQQRNSGLLADLGANEVAAAQAEALQRRTMSDLLVNLARRNQSLLNRQLALIAELEQREREPEALSELFQLDHLATRIRRNAESLLVLSGDDPPRLWGRPMPLSEVVRAAAAEVEDYGRVDVLVNDHIEVAGRAVADLAHLLAELIENATTFSPPGSVVRVRSHLAPSGWSQFMLSIEDTGIGMSDADLAEANGVLSEPREVDMRRSTLGFHVVSRLARRYDIDVRVAPTPGGGLTALVTLPHQLVTERPVETVTPSPFGAPTEVPAPPTFAPAFVSAGELAPVAAVASLGAAPVAPAPAAPSPAAPAPSRAPAAPSPFPVAPVAPVSPAWAAPPAPDDVRFPVAAPPPVLDPVGLAEPPAPRELPALPDPPPPPPPPPPPEPYAATPPLLARGPFAEPARPTSVDATSLLARGLVVEPPHPPAPEPAARLTPEAAAPAPATLENPPSPEPSTDAPDPEPATPLDGLVRRVPGAGLAAALRRHPDRPDPRDIRDVNADNRPAEALDREAVRSMLSQFQASQRAGRAIADSPVDLRPPEEDE